MLPSAGPIRQLLIASLLAGGLVCTSECAGQERHGGTMRRSPGGLAFGHSPSPVKLLPPEFDPEPIQPAARLTASVEELEDEMSSESDGEVLPEPEDALESDDAAESENDVRGSADDRAEGDAADDEEHDEIPDVDDGPRVPLELPGVWEYYRPRFGLMHTGGRGVGFEDDFTTVDAFLPIAGQNDRDLLFLDLRALIATTHLSGTNVGIGYRRYLRDTNQVVGTYFYFDQREVGPELRGFNRLNFEQIMVGFDVLGPELDFRANAYLPLAFDDRLAVPDHFAGNNLYLDGFAVALSGGEVEFGVPLGVMQQFQPKIHFGAYHFGHPDVRDATGFRTRLEARFSDAVSLQSSFQNDSLSDSTFNFSLAIRYPNAPVCWYRNKKGHLRRRRRRLIESLVKPPTERCPWHRLNDRVDRFENVVTVVHQGDIARSSATGQPLTFLHVAAQGDTFGDGTIGRPYATIDQAVNDPRYQAGDIDVIYTQMTDGAFPEFIALSTDVTLVPDTQLLSNGPVQQISTLSGLRQLPLSGVQPDVADTLLPGTARLPEIDGIVTLATGTRVSGFQFSTDQRNTAGIAAGIRGTGISSYDISDNVFFGPDAGPLSPTTQAVVLAGVAGDGSIQRNIVRDFLTPLPAIQVSGTSLTGDISGNTSTGNAGRGMDLTLDTLTGNLSGNTVSNNGAEGVVGTFLTWNGDAADNTAASNAAEGMLFTVSGVGSSNVRVLRNSFSGNNAGGTEFLTNALNGTLTMELRDNVSTNSVPVGMFNYDLLKNAAATFTVTPPGVIAVNTGTVGSSDGSVVIP